MLFDKSHILYLIISSIIIVIGLIVTNKFVKTDKAKLNVIKIDGFLTILVHISYLWVDYFKNGYATVDSSVLLLAYPCNIIMVMMPIAGFLPKDKKFSNMFREFIFFAGIICSVIGIVLNQNYANNPDLSNWYILKGLISHSVMLFGSLYMLVGGLIKIRVTNCVSMCFGMIFFLFNGVLVNWLSVINGLENPNSMYLAELPFENMPWINTATMFVAAMLVVFITTEIYELIAIKKEERTLYKLFKRRNEK